FSFDTLVSCFIIDETETQLSAEDIEFLTGEIFANQSSRKKIKDTFTDILKSKQKQKLIEQYVCGSSHLGDSVLSFSTTRFVKLIGENTVSKSTIDSWIAACAKIPTLIFFELIPSISIALSSHSPTISDFKYLLKTKNLKHHKKDGTKYKTLDIAQI